MKWITMCSLCCSH